MLISKKFGLCATPILLASLAAPVFGQQSPADQPPPLRQGPGGGGPAAFRQRMMADLKERLGLSDAGFAALQPKLEQVMRLQRETSGGPGHGPGGPGEPGGRGGPGGPPPPMGDRAPSLVEQTASDLQMTIDNTDASPQDIKAGVEALRQARAKAKNDLSKAQTDLQQLLTARQEAVLVAMGLLE